MATVAEPFSISSRWMSSMDRTVYVLMAFFLSALYGVGYAASSHAARWDRKKVGRRARLE